MVNHLCDLNVFLAGAIEIHSGHRAAKTFFRHLAPGDTIEFCRATQMGFLRLLTQKISQDYEPMSNAAARAAFSEWLSLPYVRIVPEPPGIESLWLELAERESPSPKVWMDAWLAALAIRSRMVLVTFDQGFRIYESAGLDLILLVENELEKPE